jgi:arsenate reductase
VNYYTDPLDRQILVRLLTEMEARPREVLRTNEAIYKDLGLDQRDVSDDELIDLMVRHPDLIQRPIFEIDDRAVLGRPVERIAELLDWVLGSMSLT